jgi:hypothetical protein
MPGMTFEIQDAIVTSNKDPALANRIKVALQDMDGQEFPEWLEPVFPPSWYGTPEPEQKVKVLIPAGMDLIEFAHMVRYIGVVWDEETPVPADFQTNHPYRHGAQTKAGHTLIFDDKSGDIFLWNGKTSDYLKLKNNNRVEIKAAVKFLVDTITAELKATAKTHLNSPLTDLSDVSTDFIIKGTTFNVQVGLLYTLWSVYLNAMKTIQGEWKSAAQAPSPWTPVVSTQTALETALTALIAGIQAYTNTGVPLFTSLKVRTG